MTLERRDPLPAGRYWLDVFPANRDAWDRWSNAMDSVGSVTIEHTEHFDADGGSPAHDFVIWSLTAPNVAYRAAGLPAPTIADVGVQTSSDTATRPPPTPGVLEQVEQTAASLGQSARVGLAVGGAVVVVGVALAVLRR